MSLPSTPALAAIRGVVFDLDDTLIASKLDFTAIRQQVGAPLALGILEYIASLTGTARLKAEEILLAAEWQGAKQATWMPNAQALVNQLKQRHVPMAILTRNARDIAQASIDRLHIPIDYLLAREDCAPKPSPEGLRQIAQAWQLDPAEMVYIGDFKYDIEAAQAAGVVACLYVPAHRKEQSLANNYYAADWVVDDLAQLMPLATSKQQ